VGLCVMDGVQGSICGPVSFESCFITSLSRIFLISLLACSDIVKFPSEQMWRFWHFSRLILAIWLSSASL